MVAGIPEFASLTCDGLPVVTVRVPVPIPAVVDVPKLNSAIRVGTGTIIVVVVRTSRAVIRPQRTGRARGRPTLGQHASRAVNQRIVTIATATIGALTIVAKDTRTAPNTGLCGAPIFDPGTSRLGIVRSIPITIRFTRVNGSSGFVTGPASNGTDVSDFLGINALIASVGAIHQVVSAVPRAPAGNLGTSRGGGPGLAGGTVCPVVGITRVTSVAALIPKRGGLTAPV
jgi:hypothetical protein